MDQQEETHSKLSKELTELRGSVYHVEKEINNLRKEILASGEQRLDYTSPQIWLPLSLQCNSHISVGLGSGAH